MNLVKIQEMAKKRVKGDVTTLEDFIAFLEIWWSSYYKLPSNHPLFLERTIEEHAFDFYVKKFMDNPEHLNKQTIDDLEKDEEWMKREMGEEYHEDYDTIYGTGMTDEDFSALLEEIEEEKRKNLLGMSKDESTEFDENFEEE